MERDHLHNMDVNNLEVAIMTNLRSLKHGESVGPGDAQVTGNSFLSLSQRIGMHLRRRLDPPTTNMSRAFHKTPKACNR